jgi:TP901 family phage tail tape measure protein
MDRVTKIVLRGDIGDLVGKLRATSSAVGSTVKSMAAADKEAVKFRQNLTAVGDSAGKMGLVAAAGLALTMKAAVDWQTAWAGVTKTVDGTTSQMDLLEGQLRDLAGELPSTHAEIAGVAEAAGQLGVARKDVADFTEVMLKLAMSTDLDADTAATSIAQLMNVMGTAPEDVDNFASTLVALGNDGASTESQIVQMAQRISGAAKTVGLSEGEVLAFANTVASLGIEVEAGGTAVSTAFATMARAAASGGPKLESFASTAGMSAEAFATSFKEAPAEAMVEFIKGLEATQKAGGNLYAQLDAVGLADIRVSQALIGMASSGDLLTDSLKLQAQEWQRNSALNDEVAKRLDTTAAKSKIALNGLKDAAIEIGQAGLPVLSAFADAITTVTGVVSDMPDPLQNAALGALALTAGIGGSVWAASKALNAYSSFTSNLSDLGISMDKTTKKAAAMRLGVGAAGLGLAALSGPAHSASRELGVLTDAASGAAIGFSVAGPWGAAIGGGVGLLKGLMTGGQDAAVSMEGLTASLDTQTGAITENTVAWAGSALQDAGIATWGKSVGLGLDTLTDAALGSKSAMNEVKDATKDLPDFVRDEMIDNLTKMSGEVAKGSKEQKELNDLQEEGSVVAKKYGAETGQTAEEIKAAQEALDKARESALATSLSFFDFSRDAEQSFGDYLNQLEKSADAFANFSKNALRASDQGLDSGLIDKLREEGPAGALALADFANASEKEIARANRAFRNTTGLSELNAQLDLLPDDIVTQFSTRGAPNAIDTAAKVAAEYDMSPELVTTILEAKDYTKADIKAVLARLAELEAQNPKVPIGVDINGALSSIGILQRTINGMNGKTVRVAVKGGTGGGITMDADGSIHTPRGRITKFANGGLSEDHVAQIGNGHVTRMWNEPETGGEAYIPLATSKRSRSRAIAEQTIGILGGSVEWYADGGITKATRLEIKEAQARVRDIERSLSERETIKRGGKKVRRDVLRGLDKEIAQLQLREAKRELRDLKTNRAARDAAAEEARDAAEDAAKDAESNRLSVKSSATSRFGIGNATTASGVERNLKTLLVDSRIFLGLLGDLKKKGASPWLLAQLVEAGPTKGAIKLAREYATNPAALASINGIGKEIDSYGNAYAGLVGNPKFMAPGAWNSGVSSASQANAPQIKFDIHPAAGLSEATIAHQVAGQLMWKMG